MNPEKSEIIIYQSDDGKTRIDVRMENETVWLTQAQMAELFGITEQLPLTAKTTTPNTTTSTSSFRSATA